LLFIIVLLFMPLGAPALVFLFNPSRLMPSGPLMLCWPTWMLLLVTSPFLSSSLLIFLLSLHYLWGLGFK
jgi:hypothetical protein